MGQASMNSPLLHRFHFWSYKGALVWAYTPISLSSHVAVVAEDLIKFRIKSGLFDVDAKSPPIVMVSLPVFTCTAIDMINAEKPPFRFPTTFTLAAHLAKNAL